MNVSIQQVDVFAQSCKKKKNLTPSPWCFGTMKRNVCPCGHLWPAGSGQTQIRVWIVGGWHAMIISGCWNWASINPDGQEDWGWLTQLLSETSFVWFTDLGKNEKRKWIAFQLCCYTWMLWFSFTSTSHQVLQSQRYDLRAHMFSHQVYPHNRELPPDFRGLPLKSQSAFLALSTSFPSPHAECSGSETKSTDQSEPQERWKKRQIKEKER